MAPRLGLVTYQLARDWDVDTIIANCTATGFEGVELRTTHAHGVETSLSAAQRAEVRAKFAASGVVLAGLGSAFEYDAVEAEEVQANIEGTKEYVRLAADLGCPGVKVRPNRVHVDEGVALDATLEQIGLALRQCGRFAADLGVEIRLEVHGRVTCEPRHIRTILDHADDDNVFVCWNSNPQDRDAAGSIDASYRLLEKEIHLVHINELWTDYPWARLFELLNGSGYEGFVLAEIPASDDPERLMRYYRALWLALGGAGADV